MGQDIPLLNSIAYLFSKVGALRMQVELAAKL